MTFSELRIFLTSDWKVTANYEFDRMWMGYVVAYFKSLFRNFPEGAEEHLEVLAMATVFVTENRGWHFTNTGCGRGMGDYKNNCLFLCCTLYVFSFSHSAAIFS